MVDFHMPKVEDIMVRELLVHATYSGMTKALRMKLMIWKEKRASVCLLGTVFVRGNISR